MSEDATEEVAVGDRIVYKALSGAQVNEEGEDYILLSSDDLLVKHVAMDEIPE